MNEKEKIFGQLLKDLRLKKDLGLRQLAKLIYNERGNAISPSYLSDIERNARIPSAGIVEQIARVLDYDPDKLLSVAKKIAPKTEQLLIDEPTLGRLLREAREPGFKDWDKLKKMLERKHGKDKR